MSILRYITSGTFVFSPPIACVSRSPLFSSKAFFLSLFLHLHHAKGVEGLEHQEAWNLQFDPVLNSKTSLGAPWWRVKMQVKTHVALPVCFNLAHWTCKHYAFPVKKYVCVLSLSRAQDNDTLPPWSSFESSMGICKRRLTKICHSALVKLFPCV